MNFSLELKWLRFSCFWEYEFRRDQGLQFKENTFSEFFSAMEVLGMCIPYLKMYFQLHKWEVLFFKSQIIQILYFSGVQVWERSKITV